MTKRRYAAAAALMGACLWLHSCTQERLPCLTPTRASLNIKTLQYKPGNTTAVDTALPNAVFRAPAPAGLTGFVYSRASSFAIWLSPAADSSVWYMTTDTAGRPFDTLTLRYTRKEEFISNACGYAYFFELQSVGTTHNFIDSVRVSNANVTNNVNSVNLQIYVHPGS